MIARFFDSSGKIIGELDIECPKALDVILDGKPGCWSVYIWRPDAKLPGVEIYEQAENVLLMGKE